MLKVPPKKKNAKTLLKQITKL
ncbi:hypothetical protein FWK35_00030337 [Aphis craccivora]|uniref:Uncharacterized protein n=1 Tax=Aphis craccivora TaxID=307492 RepID=A0A6G0WH91_APHCR|nr:hypothetical protein FWK35_00030337 [Aphis craccivora]